MGMESISSFKLALRYILKDKVSFLLALIPVLIGILLYGFLGFEMFSSMQSYGTRYIEDYLGNGSLGTVMIWIVKIILSILLFYLINITFVMIISVIASPFNDLLSHRIEKQILGEKLPDFAESIKGSVQNLFATLFNESKKIIMVLGISLLAVAMGFIPFLTPISFVLSAMVLAIEFIDFSWSRHNMTFKECRSEYRKNFFGYSFGGLFFMFLVTIPVINIIVPAYGTSYFTVLWVKSNDRLRQATE